VSPTLLGTMDKIFVFRIPFSDMVPQPGSCRQSIGVVVSWWRGGAQGCVTEPGAALALGVAGMRGKDSEVFDNLKQVLLHRVGRRWRNGCVAMGPTLLGTADAIPACRIPFSDTTECTP
jgi:hypothetical protein